VQLGGHNPVCSAERDSRTSCHAVGWSQPGMFRTTRYVPHNPVCSTQPGMFHTTRYVPHNPITDGRVYQTATSSNSVVSRTSRWFVGDAVKNCEQQPVHAGRSWADQLRAAS
jgi:hypothetical protein